MPSSSPDPAAPKIIGWLCVECNPVGYFFFATFSSFSITFDAHIKFVLSKLIERRSFFFKFN